MTAFLNMAVRRFAMVMLSLPFYHTADAKCEQGFYSLDVSTAAQNSCHGAFATYRAVASYNGPIIQVRRSNDNSIQDFYANDTGTVGSLQNAGGASLSTWLGGSTGYVTIWSSKKNNATQTSASYQPIIDFVNGWVDFTAQSGLAYFDLPSGTVPQNIQYTVTTKHYQINDNDGAWLFGGLFGNSYRCNGFRRMSSSYRNFWWDNDFDMSGYAVGNTVTLKYDGTNEYGYINGAQVNQGSKSGWNGVAGNEFIGRATANDNHLRGQLYFLHIFKSALSDTDRRIVESGWGICSPCGTQACAKGLYRNGCKNATTVICTVCDFGTFSSTDNATTCQKCAEGTYQNRTGSSICNACPVGSFSNSSGSSSCQACPAGSFSNVAGSSSCQACSAVSFSNVAGSSSCQTCPSGAFLNVTGSTACVSCDNWNCVGTPTGKCNLELAQIDLFSKLDQNGQINYFCHYLQGDAIIEIKCTIPPGFSPGQGQPLACFFDSSNQIIYCN